MSTELITTVCGDHVLHHLIECHLVSKKSLRVQKCQYLAKVAYAPYRAGWLRLPPPLSPAIPP
jgi:hypothetical protein